MSAFFGDDYLLAGLPFKDGDVFNWQADNNGFTGQFYQFADIFVD
jgi:hypothetical protein